MAEEDPDDVFATLGIGAMDDVHAAMLMSRFDEISRRMSEDRQDSADSRRRIYAKLEQQSSILKDVDGRVIKLERSMEAAAPTLAEYGEIKAQVRGAGRLGKLLWGIGGFVLAIAVTLANTWTTISAYVHSLVTGR